MRKIMYRAIRKDNKNWAFGLITIVNGEQCILDFCDNKTTYPIFPETICETTGRYDKNGNEVFENDIVKLKSGGGLICLQPNAEFIGVVKHCYGGGTRCTISQLYIETVNDKLNQADFTPGSVEVIGDTFFNGHLLQEAYNG